MPSLIETILQRQSLSPRRLIYPGPNEIELQQIFKAAQTAPDHAGLRPYGFSLIPDSLREKLADIFIDIKTSTTGHRPDAETIERERSKACHAPCLVACYSHLQPNHSIVSQEEQWISIGAAIGVVLHGAHALGYSAILLSGNKVQASQLKSAFDLAPHDKLIGFITIGTANPEMIKPPREFITPYLNEWANSPTNSKA